MLIRLMLLPALFALLPACAAVWTPEGVHQVLDRTLDTARERHRSGNHGVAAQLLTSISTIDPDFPGLQELRQDASIKTETLVFDHPILGANVARRRLVNRSVAAKIFLYVPDRILDFLDIISFDLHLGPGVFLNLHATRAVQVGAGARAVGGIGWHDHRSLGVQFQAQTQLVLPAVGTEAVFSALAGTSGARSCGDAIFNLHRPSAAVHQEYRDFWSVGIAATFAIVGIDLDIHPLEIADFVSGVFTADFLHDDFARTAGISFQHGDEDLLRELGKIRWSPSSVRGYREWAMINVAPTSVESGDQLATTSPMSIEIELPRRVVEPPRVAVETPRPSAPIEATAGPDNPGQEKRSVEEIAWELTQAKGSIRAYKSYLTDYPEGADFDAAYAQLDKLEWAEAERQNSAQAYRHYLSQHPLGRHVQSARSQLERISNGNQSSGSGG